MLSTLSLLSLHFLAKYLMATSAVGSRQSANCRLRIEDWRLEIGDWGLFSRLFGSGYASLGISIFL
ncbi:MAG: hypothetical protein NUV76_08505 [Candidatus Kuenenia sp.]|nr:hypothetical protein [Candidatus Kuenenia sp.]